VKRDSVDLADNGALVFSSKVIQAMGSQDDVGPVEVRSAECWRLQAEARNPESLRIGGCLSDSLVNPLEPEIDVLSRDRRSLQHGCAQPDD